MENVRKLENETSSVTKAACSSTNLVALRCALQRYVAMQSVTIRWAFYFVTKSFV